MSCRDALTSCSHVTHRQSSHLHQSVREQFRETLSALNSALTLATVTDIITIESSVNHSGGSIVCMHARKSLRGIYKCECPGGYPSSSKTCSLSSSSSLPPSLTLFYYSALLLVLLNMKTAVFLLTILAGLAMATPLDSSQISALSSRARHCFGTGAACEVDSDCCEAYFCVGALKNLYNVLPG